MPTHFLAKGFRWLEMLLVMSLFFMAQEHLKMSVEVEYERWSMRGREKMQGVENCSVKFLTEIDGIA